MHLCIRVHSLRTKSVVMVLIRRVIFQTNEHSKLPYGGHCAHHCASAHAMPISVFLFRIIIISSICQFTVLIKPITRNYRALPPPRCFAAFRNTIFLLWKPLAIYNGFLYFHTLLLQILNYLQCCSQSNLTQRKIWKIYFWSSPSWNALTAQQWR